MSQGKRKSTSITYSKRKKRKRSLIKEFPVDRKEDLAGSDLGSYYNQQSSGWLEEADETSSMSSKSAQKLGISTADKKEIASVDNHLTRPGLAIVDGNSLQRGLELSASCKFCGEDLEVLEDKTSRHGLGSMWSIQCQNNQCEGRSLSKAFPTSNKSGHFFEVNRLAVLAMRSIGRGHSAAQKFFGIMGLPQPINHSRWSEHTKAIQVKCKELLDEELEQSTTEIREFHVAEKDVPVNVGVSLDGSWCTRGWSATDACVGVLSIDTGKVIDIVHKNSSCTECKKMEASREDGKVDKMEYLSWFLEHEPNCMLNHEGSSSVSSNLFFQDKVYYDYRNKWEDKCYQ